ncbi:putative Fe2OG dioxygenase domain-containing protein [Seiridium unicorne]|uniref:Fe2OG dioxygenase domain-containing protein n=1 Tax=Seiridium unicorne TaxID=138068 RepID=A0ABR2V5F2_9PEZI
MATTKLELRTALGPVYRDVLVTPPRNCTPDEIPIIDLRHLLSDDVKKRKEVAMEIRSAAVNTGFFYVKNHGISQETIAKAKEQGLNFMRQPREKKDTISSKHSKYYNGYSGELTTNISPSESVDVRESFSFRYSPELDPDHPMDLSEVPSEVRPWIRGEDFVWEGTAHLPNFKKECVAYWADCLQLARRLVRAFALSLDLAEDYWNSKVTHPGADSVFNYYRPRSTQEIQGEFAPPIEGTFVVNIGDYMMRLTNDTYISTVHRVTNESPLERVSMPFFFGLNFNCVESVIPSCISQTNPAKYEPISCGDWCQMRFKIERDAFDEKAAKTALAPSAVVVQAPT